MFVKSVVLFCLIAFSFGGGSNVSLSDSSSSSSGSIGFDCSYWQGVLSDSSISCLQNQGYTFAIIQATKASQPVINPYLTELYNKLKPAFDTVDVYIFPDTDYNPSSQIGGYIDIMLDNGILSPSIGQQVVLDVEGTSYWSSSCSSNIDWLQTAIDTVNNMYTSSHCTMAPNHSCVQIYTNMYQWNPIMCGSSAFSDYPLWYALYDNQPSFSGYSAFSGWTVPYMKQYSGDISTCYTTIDKNYKDGPVSPPSNSGPSCFGLSDGYYCGDNGVHGTKGTLYLCSGGNIASSSHCSGVCEHFPPGYNDACATANCSGKSGLYCGSNGISGSDPDGLYNCASSGSINSASHCSNGCTEAPPGYPDYC